MSSYKKPKGKENHCIRVRSREIFELCVLQDSIHIISRHFSSFRC